MWQSCGAEERDLNMTKKEIQKAVLILSDTVEVQLPFFQMIPGSAFWHLERSSQDE